MLHVKTEMLLILIALRVLGVYQRTRSGPFPVAVSGFEVVGL